MAYRVRSFQPARIYGYEHCIFVITNSKGVAINKWIDTNFERIGKEIGSDAVIVHGYDDEFSDGVRTFLERWMNEGAAAGPIRRLLDQTTCLLIARNEIKKTDEPLLLIPLTPASFSDALGKMEEKEAEFVSELMQYVVDKVRDGTILKHAQAMGAKSFTLNGIGNSMVVSTLRHVNKVIELKPNICGVGVNLNALIETILGAPVRA